MDGAAASAGYRKPGGSQGPGAGGGEGGMEVKGPVGILELQVAEAQRKSLVRPSEPDHECE